ncbi:hypothetical protein ASU31_26145 [Pedobacter ginsenosidimutans]|uniref:Uncharacterized protein n=1 Tax=Pedobacter ginsenosidimutans TaxID=687842 RepID=A0A0T5VH36_9SPHI|nr:hypothetical protein ASU31_26145 [Pedobacter ginsenosidimutans]
MEGVKLQVYIFDNLNKKNLTSLTPLDVDLKALILALKDSAEAFVAVLINKLRIYGNAIEFWQLS